MKRILIATLAMVFVMSGCSRIAMEQNFYQQISAEEAKAIIDEQHGAIILDVREPNEYNSGHIPGAVLLPVGSINEDSAKDAIPAKSTAVLVYCRSGNRSKAASSVLVELGYTQVYEFGGIIDWPYDIE